MHNFYAELPRTKISSTCAVLRCTLGQKDICKENLQFSALGACTKEYMQEKMLFTELVDRDKEISSTYCTLHMSQKDIYKSICNSKEVSRIKEDEEGKGGKMVREDVGKPCTMCIFPLSASDHTFACKSHSRNWQAITHRHAQHLMSACIFWTVYDCEMSSRSDESWREPICITMCSPLESPLQGIDAFVTVSLPPLLRSKGVPWRKFVMQITVMCFCGIYIGTDAFWQVLSCITSLKKLCNHPRLIHDAIRESGGCVESIPNVICFSDIYYGAFRRHEIRMCWYRRTSELNHHLTQSNRLRVLMLTSNWTDSFVCWYWCMLYVITAWSLTKFSVLMFSCPESDVSWNSTSMITI